MQRHVEGEDTVHGNASWTVSHPPTNIEMLRQKLRHNLSANDYRGMAQVHAALRDLDSSFAWLEKSYQRHEESLCSIKADPKINPLRNDKRFNDMLQRIGLGD
ncbi:MAG: hypothetical protein ABI683_07405 [Ginsengibacter sp.]